MSGKYRKLKGTLGIVALLILILDTKTALKGAAVGVDLCIRVVVPSLFPFFVLSGIINHTFYGKSLPFFRPLGRLCGIPIGGETLLFLGMLGGYPVGAQGIVDAYRAKALSRDDARRMLGFCNNAGPSFIFGMVGSLFGKPIVAWVLWFIHILSAIIVGLLLPEKNLRNASLSPCRSGQKRDIFSSSIKAMSLVCGWVVLFRTAIAFADRWFLWLLPVEVQMFFVGLLELSNGVFVLGKCNLEGFAFVACGAILSFGGVCVCMQTISVTAGLGTGSYFPGKVLQCCISIMIAILLQPILFDASQIYVFSLLWIVLPAIIIVLTLGMLYRNKNNSRKMATNYV